MNTTTLEVHSTGIGYDMLKLESTTNCLKNLLVTPMCHVYPLHCVTTTINSQLMPQSIKYKCWEHNHDQADEANITFSFWFQRFLCDVI